MTFNLDKQKEMILLISEINKDNPRFGSTVLNKMLYFADFTSFAILGKSISGDDYIRQDFGPTPKHLLDTRKILIDENLLIIEEKEFFGKAQKRPIPQKTPEEYKYLSKSEIKLVKYLVQEFQSYTAREISDISHTLAWQVRRNGDIIPYETVHMLSKNPIPEETIVWAQNVINDKERKNVIIEGEKRLEESKLVA